MSGLSSPLHAPRLSHHSSLRTSVFLTEVPMPAERRFLRKNPEGVPDWIKLSVIYCIDVGLLQEYVPLITSILISYCCDGGSL